MTNKRALSYSALNCFQDIVKRELFFHSLFIGLAALALFGFLFFFSFLSDTFLMGIFIACCFFGVVLYFVLKLYFQEQKPQELTQLRDDYLKQCDPKNIALACTNFVELLENTKIDYWHLPSSFDFLRPSFEKFLATYHFQDVHLFKELFLRAAVEQKIKEVITQPTEIDSHKELATSYMALAEHFQAPLESMNPTSKTSQLYWEHFQTFQRLAIEELLIVKEYAPNDLWTSTKLAECYLALGMLDQAIVEYELILEENPNDTEALFSIGRLYFKQGLHGKGLKIYEQLQQFAPEKARALIRHYGSHDSGDFRHI
jgi:tetratricopeptide (TPR) repeat protein